jgi:HTH-type transcriptional regulator, quorum sensing regulator NprR
MELKLGEKIKNRRKKLGLTLKDVAGEKVTPSQISAVEKGKCKPSSDLLLHIAKSLDVDAEYFTLTEGERLRKGFEEIKWSIQKQLDNKEYDEALAALDNFNTTFISLTELQKGEFCYIQGECFYRQAKYLEATKYYIKSLAYFSKTKDINAVVDTNIRLANCLCNNQKPDVALGYYLNAYRYIEMDINIELRAKLLFNLSVCYAQLKRYDLCREYIIKCICYINEFSSTDREAFLSGVQMVVGIINIEMRKIRDSFEVFELSFNRYKENEDKLGMGRARNNSAQCLFGMGDYEKAIEYFNEAISYKFACNDETLIDSYINLSNLYKKAGNAEKLLDTINKAEEAMIEKNSIKGLIEIFIIKFDYHVEAKEYDRAEIFAFLALDYSEKINDTKAQVRIYIKLSEMHKKLGDCTGSLEYFFKAKSFIS